MIVFSQAEWRTLCGVSVVFTRRRTERTPHEPACRCFPGFSSSAVCHLCSCVACAHGRAEAARAAEKKEKR